MTLVNKTQEIVCPAQSLCQKWGRQCQIFCEVCKFIEIHDFDVFVRVDQNVDQKVVENVCIFLRAVFCFDNITIPDRKSTRLNSSHVT